MKLLQYPSLYSFKILTSFEKKNINSILFRSKHVANVDDIFFLLGFLASFKTVGSYTSSQLASILLIFL